MNNIIKKSFALAAAACLLASLSSCTLFETMRENAKKNNNPTIYETPSENMIIEEFNSFVAQSLEKAQAVKESVSFNAGTPSVTKNGEQAGILDDAARQLKNFIMSGKPGQSEREIGASDESLLKALDAALILDLTYDRNYASENVTDDKGDNVKDENDNNVTETYVSDNILHITVNYFNSLPTGLISENGEEETSLVYAEAATIESVFGAQRDKEPIIAQFDSVKDYLQLNDYDISYTSCKLTADIDLETEQISFVRFEKNMDVTAQVTGIGSLSDYGELEVSFSLSEVTNYDFTFATEDEAE